MPRSSHMTFSVSMVFLGLLSVTVIEVLSLLQRFFREVAKPLGVKQCNTMSSSCHHSRMGRQSVVTIHWKTCVGILCAHHSMIWGIMIKFPSCEFTINNAWNQAIVSTPFFLVFGEHPRSPVNLDVMCKLPAVDTLVGRVKLRAHESLQYGRSADSNRRDVTYQVGEFALLPTKGMKLSPLTTKKLLSKWLGPFEVSSALARLHMNWCYLPSWAESILYFMCCCNSCGSIRMVNVDLHLHLLWN